MNPVQGQPSSGLGVPPLQQAANSTQPTPDPEQAQMAVDTAAFTKREAAFKQDASKINPLNISQAMATITPKSTAPQVQVGKAVSSDKNWANLCEAYAESQVYGRQGIYPDAITAYQSNAQNNNIIQSDKNIPKDAQLFFNADSGNGYNGHTMISNGNSTFRGPLQDGSIGTFTLPQWLAYSGQQYLGYAPPPKPQE